MRAFLLWLCLQSVAYASNFGVEVTGRATLTYGSEGTQVVTPTNPVTFIIVPPQVDPIIEFFRHSPEEIDLEARINGGDFSPSGDMEGPFLPLDPEGLIGTNIDFGSPVPLSRATTFLQNEAVFIFVDYVTGNMNSVVAETVVLQIETQSGDSDVLRLYESGPDTGQFFAYMPTKVTDEVANDGFVSISSGAEVVAEFEDNRRTVVNATSFSQFVPENRIFDTVTGLPLDGVTLRLLDVLTGTEATIFGINKTANYPSTIVSGAVITDSSGKTYEPQSGGFLIPHVPPGDYRVELVPPEGYSFRSILKSDTIISMSTQDREITDLSYGEAFRVENAGPLRFDIPLDPQSDLSLSLATDRQIADLGDPVTYTARVENLGTTSVPVMLDTVLPEGFRFVDGSTRQNGGQGPTPGIDTSGRTVSYNLGLIAPGASLELDFTARIGPNASLGEALTSGVVMDGSQNVLSNRALAEITLREDLLRSRSTIVGRIAENACQADAPWVRAVGRGQGIKGVRVYMETGAFVVSDQDGQFHFEGVTPGTHVVQVDRQTIPDGYELVSCRENTRYAGRAGSQFVDAKGGRLWRADFFLRQKPDRKERLADVADIASTSDLNRFGPDWLAEQDDRPDWVYPDPSRTPSRPSINVGIKHPVGARVALFVNDRPVDPANLVARDTDNLRRVMISRFKGVDILNGENEIIARISDGNGSEITTLRRTIAYVETIARASAVIDESTLVADGKTPPILAFRLEDDAGRGVHAGRTATISVPAPYRIRSEAQNSRFGSEAILNVDTIGSDERQFVGDDGILRLELEPTLETGPLVADVMLDNGRVERVRFYIRPEKRDWIVVGLAESSFENASVRKNMVGLAGTSGPGQVKQGDNDIDGRIALFAKGMIKGDWLMTLSVDTDRVRRDRDGDFLTEIDPNAYYTLYGDASYQDFDGTSRYPLYLKLEKDTAYGLFGDFETGLQEGRLTLYNRRLSGLKAEYQGDVFQLQGFAAETNQGFAKDELASDGTSGPYQLSNTDILAQSETIIVETRDRIRADIVLERRELRRFADYTLDYLTGELIFNFPVAVSDEAFNPNVIVVDYETSEQVERNITFGGRAQVSLLNDRLRIGANVISEDGSTLSAGSLKRLAGVDGVFQVSEGTELRLEYAVSDDAAMSGLREAKLAELTHTSRNLSGEVYYREEEAGFGLGQTNSNTSSLRRYGLRGSIRLSEFTTQDAARRGIRTLDGALYREDNLTTGDSREAGEVTVKHQASRFSIAAGLRAARDRLVGRGVRESVLALVRANYSIPRFGLSLLASREQPISGDDDVSDLPQRTLLGLDKTLGSKATLNLRHEINQTGQTKSSNSAIGLTVMPWRGSTLSAASDLIDGESERRLGATLSVDQEVRLSQRWSASAGLRSRRILARSVGVMDQFIQVAPDAAVSPFEINEDFMAAYVGLTYTDELMVASIRGETRQAETEDTYILTGSLARELSDELSMAGTTRATFNDPAAGESGEQVDVRVGVAWRPEGEGLIVLNRTDFAHRSGLGQPTRTKWVNNLAANARLSDVFELSLNHGIKHVREDLPFGTFSSTVNLIGLETRYDISPTLDIGLAGSLLFDDGQSGRYSYGPSIGLTPVDNVWLSVGYNFEGFDDPDFTNAEARRKGLFMKLRMKFDERTLSGLLRHISPTQPVEPQPYATYSAIDYALD